MSAPETNVEKQERRHRPVLRLIGLSVAAVLIVIFGVYAFGPSDRVNEAASGDEQLAD